MNKNHLSNKTLSRASNIELLRIIATMMVITVHYLGINGIISNKENALPFNYYSGVFIECICIICANIFMLISGYFGIQYTKSVKLRKVIDLLLLAGTYSAICFCVSSTLELEDFTIKNLICSFATSIFYPSRLWYFNNYILLYLITPFLNVMISSLSKKQHENLIIILLLCFSFLSFGANLFSHKGGYDIIQFIMLYITGSYLSLYKSKRPSNTVCISVCLLCVITTYILMIFLPDKRDYLSYDSPLNITYSVFFFMIFEKINIKSAFINYISGFSLAVYLLNVFTGNPKLFQYYTKLIMREKFYTSDYFLFHLVICVSVFFVVAILIEIIRKKIFNITVDKILDKIPITKTRLFDISKQ